MLDAFDALQRLRQGNQRFVAGEHRQDGASGPARRNELLAGQEPFAIILGCSDSRVPAELVFDQGLGDLFIIRVAGNIVTPTLVGSVEFAAASFGTRLVVVMGHSQCGAVNATLRQFEEHVTQPSPNLASITESIRPAVQATVEGSSDQDRQALLEHCIRANISASAARLRQDSEILAGLARDEGLLVVGAEYSLETGVVDFFEGIPARS